MISSKISNFYIIASIVGFLLISVLPSLLGIEGGSFSILFRGFILLLSLVVIAVGIFSSSAPYFFTSIFIFLFFWVIYSFSLYRDLFVYIENIEIAKSRFDYLLLSYGISFLPAFSLVFINVDQINYNKILRWIYLILITILSLALIIRFSNEYSVRSSGELVIGILFYGQFGASLAILSVFGLYNKPIFFKKIYYYFGLIIGVVTIFVSASRSPFLVLILVLSIYFLLNTKNVKSLFLMMLISILIYTYFFEILIFVDDIFPNSFLERFLFAFENPEEIGGRRSLIQDGINDFKNNPLFGNAFTLQTGNGAGYYPHNLIIEALMATGIIGGLMFVLWIIKSFSSSLILIFRNNDMTWVGLLFLQFLIFGMFSGTLYNSDLFWFFSVLSVLTIRLNLIESKLHSK